MAEPSPLFVGPIDERDGDRRRSSSGERAQQFEAGHHAERAIEPTALGHTVEMRADHDGVVARAPQISPKVARFVGVDLYRQRCERLA